VGGRKAARLADSVADQWQSANDAGQVKQKVGFLVKSDFYSE
jgi:hypothetical protein